MKFGLQENTIRKINSVFSKYPEVKEAIIYGSRAKGNYREGSDIDITLKGKGLTHEIFSSIVYDIDELDLPYLFDLSIFDAIMAAGLKNHINRVGQVFYSGEVFQNK